jgi:Na+/H+-dicarboxylate symporter
MADVSDVAGPQPLRALSRESCVTESAFSDFLSDGSDEDEDDLDTRKLLRMQQQADDSAYSEAPFKLPQDSSSFRLTMKKDEQDGAGPEKLLAERAVNEATSVAHVLDLMAQVERVSRLDDHLEAGSVEGDGSVTSQSKRKPSVRETESAFTDFLSDGSNSSEEEEEDDLDTRKVTRMQQQADDRMFVDTSFKMERPKASDAATDNSSFRLTLAKGVFDAHEDDGWSGPKKLVEEARRGSTVDAGGAKNDGVVALGAEAACTSDEDASFVDEQPRFSDGTSTSFAGADGIVAANRASDEQSLPARPPSFEAEGGSFVDDRRPSFSDEHSFTGGESFAADNSFVYRPSLPDDEDETQGKTAQGPANSSSFIDCSFVNRPACSGSSNNGEDAAKTNPQGGSSESTQVQGKDAQDANTASNDVSTAAESSFVYRPTLPDSEEGDDRGLDGPQDASSQSSATVDNSFVYRPTLPDDGTVLAPTDTVSADTSTAEESSSMYRITVPSAANELEDGVQEDANSSSSDTAATEPSKVLESKNDEEEKHEPSFLSPAASSFIRSSDAAAFALDAIDSSFRLHDVDAAAVAAADDSFSSLLTDSCASTAPPELDATEDSATEEATAEVATTTSTAGQGETKAVAVADSSISPSRSRQSSVASSTQSSQDLPSQRRMTAARESWRVSSLDFRESKHAFDEELAPIADRPLSPRASAVSSEQPGHHLSSTFEERESDASSYASFHSQANFFVDEQSFSSVSSLSLDSRPSGEDSFANVAILGDDGRDQNERRSSDVISQEVRSSSISATYPAVNDALDQSYSDLVDAAVGLGQSFSQLVNQETFAGDSSGTESAGTAFSSLASSAVSQSSAASDELSFVSFNAAKPPSSAGPPQQQQQQEEETQKPVDESEQVFYGSILLPHGSDATASKPSRSLSAAPPSKRRRFSSAALLAAIKTREARTDTRSEETEAGDVALGALPRLEPPLKINLALRGRGSLSSSFASAKRSAQSSPSIPASPLALSSMTRSSLASSTGTADHLDFTGVYRGSANSLEASRNNGVPASVAQPEEAKPLDKAKTSALFTLSSAKLERSTSDSRMIQRESQRKVEDFFRRTYQQDVDAIDEREVLRWTNRKTRARTTVIDCVDDVQEQPHSFAFNGTKVAKIIDLKNLRNGGKQPGWHVEDRRQQEEPSKQAALTMTVGTTSTGTTATRSMPSDLTPIPPQNYVLSPHEADAQKPKVHEKEKKVSVVKAAAGSSGSGFFAVSSGSGGDDVSRFGARRADNVSLTPTLPRLSACDSPAFSPSLFAASRSGGAEIGRSPGKSPAAFAGAASGFLWKAGSGFNGPKRSAADAQFDVSGVSLTPRPTLADRVQTLSASLASTLRRFLPRKEAQRGNGDAVTSPQSQCTAPAELARGYDHNGFYEAPFKVPDLDKPVQQRRKQNRESDRAWVRQWLVLATCAVLGVSLGAILVRVVAFNASVFNLPADEVHERQDSDGELALAAGARWLLLPGHLFVRVWTAVTTPLLVCYLATSLADLVGCADKAALVLSFRSVGYALMLAVLASIEGVLAMWMTHKAGWFQGSSSTARAEASTLSDAVGVTPLPEGAAGLLCTGDGEYLQRLGFDVFACSNASLTLPLFQDVSTNSTGVSGSGPAVFALQEVTELLASPTMSRPYYPPSLGSAGEVTADLLSSLTPANLASQFVAVEADEIASLGGLVVFSLLLGYVSGKRLLSLRREAQAAMFETVGSEGQAVASAGKSRHYIVSVLMELQLALEWLVRPMERYLAPLGFFSLVLGNVVLHHREWRSCTAAMASLLVGTLLLLVLHVLVVLPLLLKRFSSRRLPLLATTRAFAPAFLFALTTDNVALSAPVTMQCYARVLTVTRSAAQLVTAVTAALTRNGRALYLPLLLLWLLETASEEPVVLGTSDYLTVGLVSLVSCFCGGSSRLTLAMTRTLWSLSVSKQTSSLLPATMPLLLVCDVVLSRVASVATVADHLVLTRLAAEHWVETVVEGPAAARLTDNFVPSPSPLDDSQVPRPSSSALLSSVCL